MTAVIAGDGTLRCVKEEIPELKEHEVLVKVHASDQPRNRDGGGKKAP